MTAVDINSTRQMLTDVAALIAGIEAVKGATTPAEIAAARLSLDTEVTLQMAAVQERNRARLLHRILRDDSQMW